MREKILEAALEVYSSRPPCEVSVEEVAQRAGVSTGLVFYYFRTKEGLERALALHIVDRYFRIRANSLRDYLKRALEVAERSPGMSRFLQYVLEKEMYSGRSELAERLYDEGLEAIRGLLERCGARNPDGLAVLVMAMIDGLALYAMFLGKSVHEFVDEIVRLVGCED